MKVAQYPAAAGLGNDAKGHVRPARDDRNIGFASRMRLSDCQHPSIVPSGTDRSLKNPYPALRTGLLSPGPCRTDFLQSQRPVQC
jgi:hypothetical protein